MDRLQKVDTLLSQLFSYEKCRKENREKLTILFDKFHLYEKIENLEELFSFSAINLSGISLQESTLAQIQRNRYVQIIGITKIENRSKNINLKYFGKSDNLDRQTILDIVEFVLRWRLEKNFFGVDHYMNLIKKATDEKKMG